MSSGTGGKDDLLASEGAPARSLLWVGVAATIAAVVLVLTRQGGPAPSLVTPSPNPTLTATALEPLQPMTISGIGPVRLVTTRRAVLRVAVTNPNERPVELARIGQAIPGISLISVTPTPQPLGPHGSGVVLVTFERDAAGLPCDPVGGTPILVAVTSADSVVSTWNIPLRVQGRSWDAALTAAMCKVRVAG